MNNVFKLAQKKQLEFKVNKASSPFSGQSRQDSEQLMACFAEVVEQLSTNKAEPVEVNREKLRELHRQHQVRFQGQNITGPNEL